MPCHHSNIGRTVFTCLIKSLFNQMNIKPRVRLHTEKISPSLSASTVSIPTRPHSAIFCIPICKASIYIYISISTLRQDVEQKHHGHLLGTNGNSDHCHLTWNLEGIKSHSKQWKLSWIEIQIEWTWEINKSIVVSNISWPQLVWRLVFWRKKDVSLTYMPTGRLEGIKVIVIWHPARKGKGKRTHIAFVRWSPDASLGTFMRHIASPLMAIDEPFRIKTPRRTLTLAGCVRSSNSCWKSSSKSFSVATWESVDFSQGKTEKIDIQWPLARIYRKGSLNQWRPIRYRGVIFGWKYAVGRDGNSVIPELINFRNLTTTTLSCLWKLNMSQQKR